MKKKILYVCDSAHAESAVSDILGPEFDLCFPGYEPGESSLPVESALQRLRSGEEFDLIVAGVLLSYSQGNPEFSDPWNAGPTFLDILRREGIQTPAVFYAVFTELWDKDNLEGESFVLKSGERVRIFEKSQVKPFDFADQLKKILATSSPERAPGAPDFPTP